MKKRVMAMLTAAVMAVAMLAGCGSNAKGNYEDDLKVLEQAANVIDATDFESGESFKDQVSSLSCKTAEGKLLLADFVGMAEIYDQMQAEMAKDEYDAAALNKIMEDMKTLQDTFNTHLTAFKDAATAAGVDTSGFETDAEEAEGAAEEAAE